MKSVIRFCSRYYKDKDSMHGLEHAEGIYLKSLKINKKYRCDKKLLFCGAYFHGLVKNHFDKSKKFLDKNFGSEFSNKVLQIAKESHDNPISIEGKILHDSHLLEGGKAFFIIKTLIVGVEIGRSLKESIKYLKNINFDKYKCALPESKKEFKEKVDFTKEFLRVVDEKS